MILLLNSQILMILYNKLVEKCDREGIAIDEVSLEAKAILQTKHVIYQSQNMLLVGLRVSYVLLREA